MAKPAPLPAVFRTIPLAHRGLHGLAHGCAENSCTAFRGARDAGYGIELDIQMSRDGEAMVIHDYVLERLTGREGFIAKTDAADLGRITLTGGSDTIPTLREVLRIVGGQVPLLVELKDQDGALGRNVGRMARRVAELLDGYRGPLACMSFNPHAMAAMREVAPDMVLGLATGPFESEFWSHVPDARLAEVRAMPDLARVGAGFISHKLNDLTVGHVAVARAAGLSVLSWTIRSLEEEKIVRSIADNITFEGYLPEIPVN